MIGLGSVGGALARGARGRRAPSSSSPTSTRRSARSPRSWAPPGPTPEDGAHRGRRRRRARARSAACSTTTTVPALRCRAVAGAANNQLAAEAVADLLHARGILWTPDFVANAGGIINIAVELEPEGYDPARARERVLAVGDTVRTRPRRRRPRRRHAARRRAWRSPARTARRGLTRGCGQTPAPPRAACRGARGASRSRAAAGPPG